jgi:hypothetical protein
MATAKATGATPLVATSKGGGAPMTKSGWGASGPESDLDQSQTGLDPGYRKMALWLEALVRIWAKPKLVVQI